MSLRHFAFGFLLVVLAGTPNASASAAVEPLLRQAEAIRSANVDEFARLLRELEAHKEKATREQRHRLAYLHIYADTYAGRFDPAISKARQLIRDSSDVDIQLRANALMINSYALSRRFIEGLQQSEQISGLMEQAGKGEAGQHVRFAMANLYNQVGQHRLGLREVDSLLNETGTIPPRTRCFVGQLRLQLLQGLGELPTEDASIIRAIDECVALQEPIVANLARMVLARQWAARGERDKAIAFLRASLPEAEATRYPHLISQMHSLLAEWLLERGDSAAAQLHASTATAQGRSSLLPLVAAYRTLYQIAEQQGDTAAALRHYRRYSEADKAYLNDVKARELAYQLVSHETQQKTQEIRLLNQQNQLLQLQQRVQKQANQNMGLMVVLLASLLAGIGLWASRIKRMHVSLRQFAETDALTGISNRHHFTQQAERSLSQCKNAGESAAVIMFDLDRFKAINDTYGHDAGDWVLKQVAETCSGLCRRIDHFGRVGGEEFAILLHGCELNAAVRLAEDCRIRLANIESRDSGHAFAVTASFGVSATRLSGYGLSTLMSHADLVLYRAKREGRNRVRAYTGDLPLASPVATLLPLPVQSASDGDVAAADSSGVGRSSRGVTS